MNFLRNLIQGSHSASKADSDHKKKGGVPPPGSADPPCKLEEEAEAQRVTTEPLPETVNGSSPPASPTSPLPDASPPSVTKDCETPSTTEEASFASCLTEPSSAAVGEAPSTDSAIKNPDCSFHSVPLSVPQNSAHNGVKKDSEYESAEETDQPQDPAVVVTQQPISGNLLPSPSATDQISSSAPAFESSDQPDKVEKSEKSELVSTPGEIIVNGTELDVENGCVENEKVTSDSTEIDAENKVNDIHESLVTVTKSEIIEESVSTKTLVHEEITQVVANHIESNGDINTDVSEIKSDELPEKEHCEISESTKDTDGSCATEKEEETCTSNIVLDNTNVTPQEPGENQVAVSEESKVSETPDTNSAEHTNGTSEIENHTAETVVDDLGKHSAEQVSEVPCNEEVQQPAENIKQENAIPPQEVTVDNEDLPIPPKKGYNLDFLDSLDDPNFNPFATKTAVRNTPPPSPEPGRKLPPLKPAVKKKKDKVSDKSSAPHIDENENQTQSEVDVKAPVPECTETVLAAESKPEEKRLSGQLLEVTFEESSSSPKKAPPKLNKKSVPNKKPVRKPISKPKVVEKNNNTVDNETVNDTEHKSEPEEDLPIPPSKGYNLDFLDNLDDPNFNPFATKTAVSNSPPKEGFTVPNDQEIKLKAKVVSVKKAPAKKGFTVLKNKAKSIPEKEHKDSEAVQTHTTENPPEDTTQNPPEDSTQNPPEDTTQNPPEEDIPVPPKKGYNLDFLDDPNFDPFQTRSPVNDPSSSGSLDSPKSSSVDSPESSRQVIGGSADKEQEIPEIPPSAPEAGIAAEPEEICDTTDAKQNNNVDGNDDLTASVGDTKDCEPATEALAQEQPNNSERLVEDKVLPEAKVELGADALEVLSSVKEEATEKPEVNSSLPEESKICENGDKQLNSENGEQESVVESPSDESSAFYESDINVPKVPSIGTIGQLDSLEFAQLLGDEASRLAEEFMNCSTDSGLPDSADSVRLDTSNSYSNMADKDCSAASRLSAHIDDGVNPFQKRAKLPRSPPLGKRDVCGAEGGNASETYDPYKARRNLVGEERLDTSSLDDDSGIALGTRSDLETDINHSEAGPEIATGLTSSDLQCASQFFKEATDMENQLRKSLGTPLRGSQSKLSGDEVTPTKDKPESSSSTPEPQNKSAPSTSTPVPPHEERSAPEGTSSPTPRPSDTSEHKPSSSRPLSLPSEGYMTAAEVQKLLKQQELQFEEKLLRAELAAGEKEKKLRQAMKDEQKEKSGLTESVGELTKSRDALLKLVGQYKGMLAALVGEKEKEKQNQEERIKSLEQERNQALEDLANVEVAFSDVHRKYERTKQVVDTLKRNEETLRGAVSDYENKLQKQEQKFIEFQKHAEEKIQLANEEFEAMRRANDQEMTKMAALLKKAEMKIMSLQDSNDRKTRENQELTQLCDDLINKVGTSH